MRKVFLLSFFYFLTLPLYAEVDGRTTHGPLTRIAIVEARGISNFAAIPLVDFPRTLATEVRMHHWLWPVTFIPRFTTNFLIRFSSSIYDMAFYPWIVPFTDDISPITEPMGLPEYPWRGWED